MYRNPEKKIVITNIIFISDISLHYVCCKIWYSLLQFSCYDVFSESLGFKNASLNPDVVIHGPYGLNVIQLTRVCLD